MQYKMRKSTTSGSQEKIVYHVRDPTKTYLTEKNKTTVNLLGCGTLLVPEPGLMAGA